MGEVISSSVRDEPAPSEVSNGAAEVVVIRNTATLELCTNQISRIADHIMAEKKELSSDEAKAMLEYLNEALRFLYGPRYDDLLPLRAMIKALVIIDSGKIAAGVASNYNNIMRCASDALIFLTKGGEGPISSLRYMPGMRSLLERLLTMSMIRHHLPPNLLY